MTDVDAQLSDGRLLDRETYRRLLIKRDGLAAILLLARLAFHTVLVTFGYYLFSTGHRAIALLALVPHFLAWSFLGWAGLGHELFHRSVFSSRRLNLALFRLFSILTWSNFGYFEVTHPIHHRHTLQDSDIEANPQGRLLPLALLALLTVDVAGFVRRVRILTLNSVGVVGGDVAKIFPPGSPEFLRLRDGARVVLASQAALVTVCLWLGSSYLAVVISLAPFCLTFVNRTLAALQHFGLTASEIPGRYEVSTRTVILDPISEFFYAGMNYHVEHHYFPTIPHYHLRRVHEALVETKRHRNLETGYWSGLRLLAREGFFSGRPVRR